MLNLQNFEIPASFKLAHDKVRIFIIGVGGTGGYVFPNLARLGVYLKEKGKDIKITLVDGDIIENKNVGRQNFFFPDVGKGKAGLLATRHSRLFGEEYAIVPAYIEDIESFEDLVFTDDDYFPIVVGCVDNHKTRQLIHEAFIKHPEKFIWADAGNDQFSGQVVVGYNSPDRLGENDRGNRMFALPSITQVFPEIIAAESLFNSEVSCDDLSVENIQNISANLTAANTLFCHLNTLLGDNDSEGLLTTFLSEFNARTGLVVNTAITPSNVNKYLDTESV